MMRNECTRNNHRLLPLLPTPPCEALLVARFLAGLVGRDPLIYICHQVYC
jgi:hypothetical protein